MRLHSAFGFAAFRRGPQFENDSRRVQRFVAAGLVFVVLLGMCGLARAAPEERRGAAESAADLRVHMNSLLCEYALLSWSATLTAGDKHQDAFKSAAAALEENANDLARIYGQVYGDKAGSDFSVLWKRHVAAILDYAQATVKKNSAARDQASKFLLDTYATQVGALIAGMTGGRRPADVVTRNTREYLVQLTSMADAQAIHDYNNEYRALDETYAAMQEIARNASTAAAQQFPTRYVGSPDSATANLRVDLDSLLALQVFTQGMAYRAIVASNMDEYYALLARSDLITDQLTKTMTTYGGTDFGTSFSAEWKKYTASLLDFEKASESKDNTTRKRILGDMEGHVNDIVALFIPPPPMHAVPPPRKGKKRPKAPPPPPFHKDVRAWVDSNLDLIKAETHHQSMFGPLRKTWNETRHFTDEVSRKIVARFGSKPAEAGPTDADPKK